MKKLLIVMNPVSGKLKGVKNKDLIERSFSEIYDTRLMLTEIHMSLSLMPGPIFLPVKVLPTAVSLFRTCTW